MTGSGDPGRSTDPPLAYAQTFRTDPVWSSRFEAVAVEARERGLDPFSPEDFSRLAESRAALRHLLTGDESPEVRTQWGAMLFQAWHFSRAGERVRTFSEEEALALVTRGPHPEWIPSSDADAGFVQLPAAIFIAPTPPGDPTVWMDGFFWARGNGALILLVVLAAAGEQFTLLPLPPLPLTVAGPWATESVRKTGDDFAPLSPGAGPHAITVAGEMMKLAIRALWRLTKESPEGAESLAESEGGGAEAGQDGSGSGEGGHNGA